MNLFAAVIAGMVATIVMSIVIRLAPMMGMPKMAIVPMLATMFGKANQTLGWILHLMMGSIFALIYAYLLGIGVGNPGVQTALLFGLVHWLLVGLIMGFIPIMHAGIKNGEITAPGFWMMAQGGAMAFVGGLIGHLFFALTVFLIYGALR